jgi:hypothetical protein
VTRQRSIRNKNNRRPVHTIVLQSEVGRRVGAGQVKVGDVASLGDLTLAAA